MQDEVVVEAETCGRLPKRIYAIQYAQRYMGKDGKEHTKTQLELFSHKSTADYYAEKAGRMDGWRVKYLYTDCTWAEAEWEEINGQD